MSTHLDRIHAADLDAGRGETCTTCGGPARGSASVNDHAFCHPSCPCHPDCYWEAVTLTVAALARIVRDKGQAP